MKIGLKRLLIVFFSRMNILQIRASGTLPDLECVDLIITHIKVFRTRGHIIKSEHLGIKMSFTGRQTRSYPPVFGKSHGGMARH
jgi:hypothetical protein